ncbi:hypothetical protein LR090_00520 [Candidatus Bipolaricaulota bacterium]|nr:hypothetical protein [Candidatus Bipolaricaulota bacterium]
MLILIFGIRVFGLVLAVGYLLPPLSRLWGIQRFQIGALPLFLVVCELGLILLSPPGAGSRPLGGAAGGPPRPGGHR